MGHSRRGYRSQGSAVGSHGARTQVLPWIQQESTKSSARAQDAEDLEEQLSSDPEVEAHSAAVNGPDAERPILEFASRGWLRKTTREELRENCGDDFAISDFCVITKETAGRMKKKIILDLKKSGVSRRIRKTHRAVLPRFTDAIKDILELLSTKEI